MRLTNSPIVQKSALALLVLLRGLDSASSAQQLHFRKSLTATQQVCLTDTLRTGDWRFTPQFHQEMIAAAAVAQADLKGNGRQQYIFMIVGSGFCGSAGCRLLIAEMRRDGTCHEIYAGAGTEAAIRVLRKRDHGYRRLYTPCEIRFNGHEYQQIRWQCPTIDIQR